MLGGGVGVLEPGRAGAGVRATRVEHHGADGPTADDLLGPEHRRGLHPVGGEDTGDGRVRAVVDHQRHVRGAAGLEPGGDARRPESLRSGHAHGATP
jgi:hypothetical protein